MEKCVSFMKKIWWKIALPVVALGVGIGGMKAITASADKDEEKEIVDTRPTVKVEAVVATDYPVMISSFGEVQPLESTLLAAQVSGEVVEWHPNFVPGGLVKRGDILFTIEKDAYEAALLQAEADLSIAQASLIEEQARADVAKQEAKNLPKRKVTDLYLRKPQVISAKAAVKSAEARLRIARRDLANCEITAPYDALVLYRNVGVGQYVNQGATVAQINNIESAEVTFPIAGFDSAFLPRELAGEKATIIGKGIRTIEREGTISRDLGVIDETTRMSQLVVRINDPYSLQSDQPELKFGSYVEVQFVGRTLQKAFKLPQDLVTNRTVWVLDKDDKMIPKQVDILRESEEFFLVGNGLTENDRLVMTLPEYPQEGMAVKIAEDNNELVAQQ